MVIKFPTDNSIFCAGADIILRYLLSNPNPSLNDKVITRILKSLYYVLKTYHLSQVFCGEVKLKYFKASALFDEFLFENVRHILKSDYRDPNAP